MLVTLLVVVLVLGLLLYAVQMLPLAQPFKVVAVILVVVIAIVVLLGYLPGHHAVIV